MPDPMPSDQDDAVHISIPASAEHVAVLRAAAAVVATRLDFSLDDIDDLRILIDEAASVLLMSGAMGRLECDLAATGDSVRFRLAGRLPEGQEPHGEGFAWSILHALAHEVSREVQDGSHVVAVTRLRGPVLDTSS